METVIQILMERDELTRSEAKAMIEETIDRMLSNPWEAEQILMDDLGLEPDYIIDLIG